MKRIIALIIFCSAVCMTSVFSQAQNHMSVSYDMSFATGDLGDFISNGSFRGASFQYRNAVAHHVLLGADLSWNVFYEKKDYDSYTSGTKTLSGVQYRYQNQVPILLAVDYSISPDKDFQPYIGLGIGTIYSERNISMGIWYIEENPWQFIMKPELGFMYKFAYATAFKLAAKYNVGFGGSLGTLGYVTVSAGFAWGF